jgi:hypothetical protein
VPLTNLGGGPTRLFVAAPPSPGRRQSAVEGVAGAWVREVTPILWKMFVRCRATVRSLMYSALPICRLECPSATSASTSHSRRVSPSGGSGAGRCAPSRSNIARAFATSAAADISSPSAR